MEGQNIEFASAENVNDNSNLINNFWPQVNFNSVSNNIYVERFTPLEAYDENTQVNCTNNVYMKSLV